jgi:hypothetical protein
MGVFRTIALAAALAATAAASVATAAPTKEPVLGPTDLGRGIKLGIQGLNNSGQIGTVNLFKHGNTTLIQVRMEGSKDGELVSVQRAKQCEDEKAINPAVVFALNKLAKAESLTTVNAKISELLSGNYAITLRSASTKKYVACGHLRQELGG